tara:strand:+ start:4476 stop:6308 length:1833 start_codon:yes stop_codon:yes gene_type:complete
VPVDFKQGNDTGLDNADSVQPISNGEPLNQTTLRRPEENLRVRSETLKTVVNANERIEALEKTAYLSSKGAECEIVALTPWTDPGMDGADPEEGYAIPPLTANKFHPLDAAQPLILASPAVPGGKVTFKQARFGAFHTEATVGAEADTGVEFGLSKRGDTIALIFPKKGASPVGDAGADKREGMHWYPDNVGAGSYPALSSTLTIDVEGYLIKLPERTVMGDSAGPNYHTLYGATGTTAVLFDTNNLDYDGIAPVLGAQNNGVWLNITSVAGGDQGTWYGKGGRGGRRGFNGNASWHPDYLRVLGASTTAIYVEPTNPFRIVWPSNQVDLTWNLYTKANDGTFSAAGGGAAFTQGFTDARDHTKKHIVPLVTYTGEGYVFGPNAESYIDATQAVRINADNNKGFVLPYDPVQELSKTTTDQEGALFIGCKARTYIKNGASHTIVAGSLATVLDTITADMGSDVQYHTVDVEIADLTAVAVSQTITSFSFPANVEILSVYIDIVEPFNSRTGGDTIAAGNLEQIFVQVGHTPGDLDAFCPFFSIDEKYGATAGRYQIAGAATGFGDDFGQGTLDAKAFSLQFYQPAANLSTQQGNARGKLKACVAFRAGTM